MTKIALLGCGGWGKNLGRNLSELGALALIVDPAPTTAALAAEWGVEHADEPGAALDNPEIAGVVIATPAVTHFALAQSAMRARKDVFVEKPIALSTAEGARLAAVARETGRILMVGHLLQYHPVFVRLKALVAAGAVGRIGYISSTRMSLGLIRTEENVMWSFAPHDISMILAIAGAVPDRVKAVGTAILQPGICDMATLHMTFADGLAAQVGTSWLSPEKQQKLTVVGEKAMAVFSDTAPWAEKLSIHQKQVDWSGPKPRAQTGSVEFVDVDHGEPLRLEVQHFLDCIATRDLPRTDSAEALRVLAVLEAGQRSLDRNGDWVAVASL